MQKTNIDTFIDALVKQQDFPDLTPGIEKQLKKEARKRLDNFLLDRIVTALPNNDVNEFITMAKEKKSNDAVIQFITGHIDNYETFINEAVNDFATVYLTQ